jgi:hypothetical protein
VNILPKFHESERMEVTEKMISEAVKLIELDEDDLYERLGLSFMLSENLKETDIKIHNIMKHARAAPTKDEYQKDLHMRMSQLTEILQLLTLRKESIKKGKRYFEKYRKILFQKICVEKEACKWSKEVLGDVQSLLSAVIPLVGTVLGKAVPALVITVAVLIIKWGIIKFCKCQKP